MDTPDIFDKEWRFPRALRIWLNIKLLLLAISFPLSMLYNSSWNFRLLRVFFLAKNCEVEKHIENLLALSSKLPEWLAVLDSVKSFRLSSTIPSYISNTPLSVTSENTTFTYINLKSKIYLFDIISRNYTRIVFYFKSETIVRICFF